jgi:AraC-like DNA-binding protein
MERNGQAIPVSDGLGRTGFQRFDQRQSYGGAGPLADTQIPISGIALELAYSDAIAFGQAFKKWFGKMPSESRNQLTRQPPGWDGTTRAPGR